MKINVAVNFIHRVTALTTNQTLQQQKQIIFKHLRLNNYPAALINRLLNNIRSPNAVANTHQMQASTTHNATTRSPPTGNQPTSSPTPTLYRSLPFIPVLTASLTSILKKDYPNVKIANKTIKTNSHILNNIRDPVNPLQKSKVIYSIPCDDCQMTYIGMTKNKLQQRLYGHKSDINKYNKIVDSGITNIDDQRAKIGDTTALIDHCVTHQHVFDLNKVKIIDTSFKASALPVLEMCHISNTSNTVNHRTDVDGLSTTYSGILHTIKTSLSRRNGPSNNNHTNTSNSPNVTNRFPTSQPTTQMHPPT